MIYWAIFTLAVITSASHFFKQTKNIAFLVFIFITIVILFINGFKYASIDYFNYLELFKKTSFNDIGFPFYTTSGSTSGMEFLWATFSSLFKYFEFSFESWVFSVALATTTIKFYFYKKYLKYYLIALMAYLSILFSIDLGQLRNGLMGAILLFAVQPILKKQFINFLVVVIIASSIQVFAWVTLPLYFLYWQFVKRPKLILIITILLFLISATGGIADKLIQITFLPEALKFKLIGYAERESSSRYTAFSFTGTAYLVVFAYFYKYKNVIYNMKPPIHVLGVFFVYGLMLSYFFTGVNTAQSRSLDMLTAPSLIFIFTFTFEHFKNIKKRTLILTLGITFFIIKLYVISSAENGFAPYKNILF